ncbi:MAG: aldehyde dehydrogenase family protein [Phycisphaerales bacterium]|nr:aldehyde dehydrogenase family protein [Phycisphaerales bacterium]
MAIFPWTKRGTTKDQSSFPLTAASAEERAIQTHGLALLTAARSNSSLLSASAVSQKFMDFAMKDENFKVQLFRFVDAFPMLRTPEQVHEHLVDYMTQPGVRVPGWIELGIKAGGIAKGLFARTMSGQIVSMAGTFIAGRNAHAALPTLEKLWREGFCFSVDLLGEACVSDEEARQYQTKYLDLIENLPSAVSQWPQQSLLEQDHLGAVPRVNVSIKISSLHAHTDPIDTAGSINGLVEAITPILRAAKQRGVFVNFDMEQAALKQLTIDLFMRCCEAEDFHAGIALQAYLRSGDSDAQQIIAWARRTGRQVSVRLVKGAYWDFETINAEQQGWPCPVWGHKRETDACFERMASAFVDATPRAVAEGGVKLALGSHNARSIAAAMAALDRRGLPPAAIELQMLYGMGESLRTAARARGYRVREYVPVGEMIPGMAYLVRRLLENTSNESWLRAGFMDNASPESLLASPHTPAAPQADAAVPAQTGAIHELAPTHPEIDAGKCFSTEPLRDFSSSAIRDAFAGSITSARLPSLPAEATVTSAKAKVEELSRAFPAWRDRPWQERAQILIRAAAQMRDRRDELSGIMIREAGKTWREADADVCEAIDFCEFYAREAGRLLGRRRMGRFVGEIDEEWHQGRGVAAVISPWNFPLAICCGMTVAALVCGNTVAVKPAEQTPAIAQVMCEILWRSGVPREVLAILLGPGETVGATLVRDPAVAIIAFTGSKAVGLDICAAAGMTLMGQPALKRVVCEMGGKNAIIVDASADLDEAVLGVRQSAFGFAGQKCSACSRVIVVETAHDAFLHRLVEATRCLSVGDPLLAGTDVGPVIDEEAAARIRRYIDLASRESKLEVSLPVPAGLAQRVGKPFIGPTIFSAVKADQALAREEIFGPVLAVMKARDFDEALAIANAPEYRLTGGLYSRQPSHLERAKRDFHVGNLYLNRSITGALVGRQPFGGFGMSGTGSKAGGRDYLLHFLDARACCENAMRRGFAPSLV